MKPIDFPEATTTFNAPAGQEHSVYPLRAYADPSRPLVIECWRPTIRERLSILFFGRVWVSFLAVTPQPIDVEGIRSAFKPAPKESP